VLKLKEFYLEQKSHCSSKRGEYLADMIVGACECSPIHSSQAASLHDDFNLRSLFARARFSTSAVLHCEMYPWNLLFVQNIYIYNVAEKSSYV